MAKIKNNKKVLPRDSSQQELL